MYIYGAYSTAYIYAVDFMSTLALTPYLLKNSTLGGYAVDYFLV